jgi:hypothetical protein
MIELLASVIAEPMSAPLWGVFLMAAGMYPVGLMLGSSCSPCCGVPCSQCTEGALPETVTVTLDNMPNQTKGPDLLTVQINSCYGAGAEFRITTPGGDPEEDAGPISLVEVTNGGSGYAKLARVEPALTITGSGEGATFTPTLEVAYENCASLELSEFTDVPYWKIASVAVEDGTNYQDGEQLVVTVAEGDVEQFAASLILRTTRTEPDLTATVGGGEGAEFSISYEELPFFTPTLWGVDEVTVTSGGTGYVDGTAIKFELGERDVEAFPAYAVIRNVREEPELKISFGFASIGTGAQLTPVLEQVTDFSGLDIWRVASVTVDDGGTEYTDYEQLIFTTDDTEREPAYAEIMVRNDEPTITVEPQLSDGSSGSGATLTATLSQTTDENGKDVWEIASVSVVDAGQDYIATDSVSVTVTAGREIVPAEFELVLGEDGEILSVTVTEGGQHAIVGVIDDVFVYWGGEYFRDTGVVSSVEVFDPGGYYQDDGVPASVDVSFAGRYYREDPDGEPYVSDIDLALFQVAPSDGSGAELEAVVELDTGSADFGKIVGVNVVEGGDGYLAWEWRNGKCCGDYYDGMPIVLKRNNTENLNVNGLPRANPCVYSHRLCGVGNRNRGRGEVALRYNGPSSPPTIQIRSEAFFGASDDFTASSRICDTTLMADRNITDCGEWGELNFTATNGATATVEAGGDYDVTFRSPGGSSCSICCKGEEPTPSEIEVTVTDSKGFGNDYSGTYVLNRATIAQRPFVGDGWFTIFPGGNFDPFADPPIPAIEIILFLTTCSSQGSTSFEPEDYTEFGGSVCDDCHKKCRFRVSVKYSDVGNLSSVFTSTTLFDTIECVDESGLLSNDPCGRCEETPICSPAGRSFTLCGNNFTGNFLNQCSGGEGFVSTCGQMTIDT